MKLKKSQRQSWILVLITLLVVLVGFVYNPSGQFSDIRPFYGMRYSMGDHPWPFTEYLQPGATSAVPPIEYPALTGLIIWILTFFVPETVNATMNYFYLSCFLHGLLFVCLVLLVRRLSNPHLTYLLILSPAVITSLNRNWDVWVMVPTVASILLFEQKRYSLSALVLGIAISTKFFPIVLLLPITIFFLRNRKIIKLVKFYSITGSIWLVVNVPVALVNFEGWSYFYRLSFNRGLGDGSVFTIPGKFGFFISFGSGAYFSLNLLLFLSLTFFLWRYPQNLEISQSAFLAVTAFTFFGKQYSMQYVLWLAPLAVIAIATITKRYQAKAVWGFLLWQGFEIVFHHAYYQNLLARVLESRGAPMINFWSDFEYGIAAVLRYVAFLIFLGTFLKGLSQSRILLLKKHRTGNAKK